MQHAPVQWLLLTAGVASIVAAASAREPATKIPASTRTQGRSIYDLKECPRHWDTLSAKNRVFVPPGGFALIGPKTNVPEFHDCQKLLVNSGRTYGPLVAIFAAYDLERLEFRLDSLFHEDSTKKLALAGGLILNLGDDYPALKIKTGFSCLYLWKRFDDRLWQAKVVWVDTKEDLCLTPINWDTLPGANLQVRRDAPSGFKLDRHYPATARWDWDSTTTEQHMGIRCGVGWCNVGNVGFRPSPPYLRGSPAFSKRAQVQRIKGWYDEQHLAVPTDAGETLFVRGPVKGTLIPDTSLGQRTLNSYTGRWLPIAYIAMSGHSPYYIKKLNLHQTKPDAKLSELNRLLMCRGTRDVCGVPKESDPAAISVTCAPETLGEIWPGVMRAAGWKAIALRKWWVRIVPPPGTPGMKPMYRCVTRTDHSDMLDFISSTARWRWLVDDETVWKECLTGCCHVEVDG